jgi:FkbM family methyltransferase
MYLRHKLLLWRLKWMNISGNQKQLKHIKIRGHKVSFKKGLEMIHAYREIYKYGIYSFPASHDAPVILDCGAHIGISILYFKQLYPKARVTGFEPDAESFGLLTTNTSRLPDVKLEQKAVWTHDKGVHFAQQGDMSSHIVNDAAGVSIPCVRLRDYLTGPVDMLKIDIEGAELDVLLDCKDRLHLVKNLFVEFHGKANDPRKLQQLLSLFTDCKLDYYIKPAGDWAAAPFVNMVNPDGWDVQLNIFCVNNNFKSGN